MDTKETKPQAHEPDEQDQNETAGADSIRQELEDLRKEKDDLVDRLQRVYADYANFQKRVPRNIADTVAYEKERFMRSFLPVLDNFDRTLREANAAHDFNAILRGVEIIRDQMLNTLKSHGVEQIEALHEKFDPERHEAMLRRSEPDKENDLVLEEFQKGYTLNGRILRPSRVAVNKVQAPAGESPAQQQTKEKASEPGTEAAEAASDQDQNMEQ